MKKYKIVRYCVSPSSRTKVGIWRFIIKEKKFIFWRKAKYLDEYYLLEDAKKALDRVLIENLVIDKIYTSVQYDT